MTISAAVSCNGGDGGETRTIDQLRLGSVLFSLCIRNPSVREYIGSVLGHLYVLDEEPDGRSIDVWCEAENHCFQFEGEQPIVCSTLDGLLEQLVFQIVEIAYRTPETLAVLHAGAVGVDDQAYLFIGSQGSGKTTLIADLSASNYHYLCDDVCPVNADGKIIPIPTSQAIKEGSWRPLSAQYPLLKDLPVYERFGRKIRYLAPTESEREVWDRVWDVKALIFPEYTPDGSPHLKALSAIEKFESLVSSGSLSGSCETSALLDWLAPRPAYSIGYATLDQARHLFGILLTK